MPESTLGVTMRVGFVGLGDMGGAIAGRIQLGPNPLRVFARTPTKAASFVEAGATLADDLADLARTSDVVMVCVGYDHEVKEVCAELLRHMTEGSVLVIHSTVHADLARWIDSEARPRGVSVLDSPVSGGRPGALAGTLSLITGGEAEALERVRPILELYGTPYLVGPVGAGAILKALNNYLMAVQKSIVAQTAKVLEGLGLDLNLSFTVLANSTASTVVMKSLVDNGFQDADGNIFVMDHGMRNHLAGPVKSASQQAEVVSHARDAMAKANVLQADLESLACQALETDKREAMQLAAPVGSQGPEKVAGLSL